MESTKSNSNGSGSSHNNTKSNNGHPRTTIDYAQFPRDTPSALEHNVITIICGNSRLHWTLHDGCLNKFRPIIFWHTPHNDQNEGSYEEEEPCDLLEAHVVSQAHALIFGEDSDNDNELHHGEHDNRECILRNVSETAARRDAPGISVFVISSNPAVEKKICFMFRDVPAKIFKLRNTDFFSPEQGLYPTMGVDRAAALYGARVHYGTPALVIDGGTAMTYSAIDGSGNIVGGGISPGVKIRLHSLAEYTGALPEIDHKQFKSVVEGAIASKTPLPFFARDTELAMISPVCSELACQLRNIVSQFEARFRSSSSLLSSSSSSSSTTAITAEGEATAEASPKQPKKFPVIVTGGDGKFLYDLLQADASGIVALGGGNNNNNDNNNNDNNNHRSDDHPAPDRFSSTAPLTELKSAKNLVPHALGNLLHEKFCAKPVTPEENLKLKIQALRIAAPAIDRDEIFSRGCVYHTTPDEFLIEGYIFHARFDNGIQKDLSLRELYDCLVLYNEIGEKPKGPGIDDDNDNDGSNNENKETDEDWVKEKKMWSKKVQEELGNVSRSIRNRMRELGPFIQRGEVHTIFRQRSTIRKNKRSKMARRTMDNPQKYLNKRIAKSFPTDTNNGNEPGHQIFFGTVRYLSDSQLLWYFVQYDDGDREDIDLEEVLEGMALYQKHKQHDTNANVDSANANANTSGGQPTGPKTVLPVGRKPSGVLLHDQHPHNRDNDNDNDTCNDIDNTVHTDLSTLLSLPMATAWGADGIRRISEFKEDV